jgi:hypothetical protein
MTYETFLEIVETLQETDETISDLYKKNVDLMNFVDPYHKIITLLILEVYGKEGADWFSWFCYENDFGERGYEAWDEDGNLICQDTKSTWEYLQKNYKKSH